MTIASTPPVKFSASMRRWSVTGHAAAREILRDPAYRTDGLLADMLVRLERGGHAFPALRRLVPAIIVFMDPPDHGPARRRIARLLGYHPLSDLQPVIRGFAAAALAETHAGARFDLVQDFARPLAVRTIAHVLGLDPPDAAILADASAHLVELLEIVLPLRRFHELDAVAAKALACADRVIADRRRTPREDSLSAAICESSNTQDDEALAAACVFVFMAGVETSLSSISGAVRRLFADSDALAELRRNSAGLPAIIEDLLRLHSAVQTVIRVATEPREVAGVAIPVGAALTISIAAANRDPAVFPAPGCPMLHQSTGPAHLAFGERQHYCLGAQLARTLVTAAVQELLTSHAVTLLTDEEEWADRGTMRSLHKLPVLLSAHAATVPAVVSPERPGQIEHVA